MIIQFNRIVYTWILLAVFVCQLKAQPSHLELIPQPQTLVAGSGTFRMQQATPVYADVQAMATARFCAAQLGLAAPKMLVKGKTIVPDAIVLRLKQGPDTQVDAYNLSISQRQILLTAGTQQGLLQAFFTLRQIRQLQPDQQKLPSVEIADAPRFGYRGLHIDVSRNFVPVTELEKLIDLMALYKLNTFHWHLTDGPGWRLEIKKYPILTQIAAWRTHRTWKEWWTTGRQYAQEGAAGAYGGYYTQEQARALVAYAAQRGIAIIPEIEMPGHAEEVLAVMPQLACSGKPYTQSEFCLGNDSTFSFLEDVLTEVMQIFPSKYIHVGGDEADKSAWKKCPKCQARIHKEGLKDEHELQSYAVRRLDRFLAAHGRKLLGWDEILEGGLSPGATVMSWRGEAGGIAAAKADHDVVMTPGGFCYFDNYQSDPASQPEAIGGFLPIDKVYSYDPVPAVLQPDQGKHILGVQANVWTEYIPTTEHLEYMIFPRLLAISEVAWTDPANKSWEGFQRRLQQQYLLLQRNFVNYYRPQDILSIKASADTIQKASLVSIASEQYQPEIHYTLDNTDPVSNSPVYQKPVFVPGTTTVKAALLNPLTGKMGPVAQLTTSYHKAVGAQVTYRQPYSKGYPAQREYTLVNGQTGSFTYGDGQWQGFEGNDLDLTLTLPAVTEVERIAINFMQITGPGVYMPQYVEYSWSSDGKQFSPPVRIDNTVPESESKLVIKPFSVQVNAPVKYIRIMAKNAQRGFLFADEILVQ
jgi:hexosaminidase